MPYAFTSCPPNRGKANLRTNVTASIDYTYDDENRLAMFEQAYGLRSVFTYDGRGRLRQRVDYQWAGTPYNQWFLGTTVRYIYDGMRVIQERDSSNVPTVSYTRGTDLSGSLEGAGGIGGLLSRSQGYSSGTGNWSVHHSYHADGNGNITYLVNSSQTLGASYRYDPFGKTISSSGSLADANVYRFSSKEIHDRGIQLGWEPLYYYGYRWYAPNLQRWVNRDPIEENGGLNLYGFAANSPTTRIDAYGLQDGQTDTDRCKARCHTWVNKLIAGGAGGFDLKATLLDCLEGCDRDPNYVPGSPLPKLPKPPIPPKKPGWEVIKECAKEAWEWYKQRKK